MSKLGVHFYKCSKAFEDNKQDNLFFNINVVCIYKNHFIKVILMSTNNIDFYEEPTKPFFH